MTEENGDQKILHQRSGTIPALADEEMMGDDDEYDDLYSDVNVGESFFQAHNQPQPPAPQVGATGGNASLQAQNSNVAAEPRMGIVSGGSNEGKYRNDGDHNGNNGPDTRSDVYPQGSKGLSIDIQNKTVQQGSMSVQLNSHGFSGNAVNVPEVPVHNSFGAAQQIPVSQMNVNPNTMVNKSPAQPFVVDNGNTMLFVGELHWWTTDAEIESVLSQYGRVKEIKFFDERVSGKSKGYCQVEFYESAAAAACKEGMNGYVFNGKACVVAFASPETLKQMGANFTGRNQGQNQIQNRRPMNDGMGRGNNNYNNNNNMNMQNGDGGRNYGRGGFARGNQGMGNRGGPWNGGMRGRGVNNGAGPYGPGLAGPGPAFGGMMHPQGMMGPGGFDPTFMSRGGGYGGGYPGLAYPGMPHSYPGVNPMGMVGIAPHVNPAFFSSGMGPMGSSSSGMNGVNGAGMWNEASGGGGAAGGGEEGGSEYGGGYEDETQEKEEKPSRSRDKERAPEWSENSSDRRHKSHHREERDGHSHSHREYKQQRDREPYEFDRGQSSSKSRSRSRMGEDDYHRSRSRSRDADYGKRRRGD